MALIQPTLGYEALKDVDLVIEEVFESLEDPAWEGGETRYPLRVPSAHYEPMRKITTPSEKIV